MVRKAKDSNTSQTLTKTGASVSKIFDFQKFDATYPPNMRAGR